ncbi:MAG: hypothetical protein WBD04_03015, partial [Candidatus Omnitrophota bacterium]
MRKNLVVGILKEEKSEWEGRAPLTPSDVRWLVEKGVGVEIESSPKRVFKDHAYRKRGAKIVNKINKAKLLVGIKGPSEQRAQRNKIYMYFTHMAKGQPQNMPLLKKFMKNKVTLVDYEKVTDIHGRRLVFFGRFAGICGIVDSLHYLGKRLKRKGIDNPFTLLKLSWEYPSLEELKKDMGRIDRHIRRKGFGKKISPFIIGITGHGNVSKGVQEILS